MTKEKSPANLGEAIDEAIRTHGTGMTHRAILEALSERVQALSSQGDIDQEYKAESEEEEGKESA